jgi:riboflavin kinase/FMN adenylyltransferase
MITLNGTHDMPLSPKGTVVTIGNFDGLHIGHRRIISELQQMAQSIGASTAVMTFRPHPRQFLRPEIGLKRLFSHRDQEDQLRQLGVNYLVVQPFSRELSETPALTFIEDYIVKPFALKGLVVGYDFSFGARREGTLNLLQNVSQAGGWQLAVIPAAKIGDQIVSSSQVRSSIEQGQFALVRKMLGRHFYVEGVVERGDGRGQSIGIPTANISPGEETVPPTGVYVTQVAVGGVVRRSVTNIGRAPTFKRLNAEVKIETHLLDVSQDLYGQRLKVEFLARLRSEKKFASANDLVDQLKKDLTSARDWSFDNLSP